MKKLIPILCLLNIWQLQAQIVFQNPSFEGVSQAHVVPAPWVTCFDGGTPDTQPGQWGIMDAGTDGLTYVSFLTTPVYAEGLSQELPSPLLADSSYSFIVDVKFSSVYNTAEPGSCYGSLGVWGGNSPCEKTELLWESGPINDTNWTARYIAFIPSQNYSFISFGGIIYSQCDGYLNTMIDNIRPTDAEGANLYIVNPYNAQTVSCGVEVVCITDTAAQSVTLLGGFIGSPMAATEISPSIWKANVQFPYDVTGSLQIQAIADFGSNVFDVDEVIINKVTPIVGFQIANTCNGEGVNFHNSSNYYYTPIFSHWDFDTDSFASGTNVAYMFPDTGLYNVTLVTGITGVCWDTVVHSIYISPPLDTIIVEQAGNLLYVVNPSQYFNYYWFLNNTYVAQGDTINPPTTGYYLVEAQPLYTSMFCPAVGTWISYTIGLDENVIDETPSIYPNPITNQLTIELPATATGASTLQICNPLGQIMYSQVLPTSGKYVFSDMGLATGYYLVRITNRDFQYTTKLLVN